MQPSPKWRFGRCCSALKWNLFQGTCLSIHLSSGPNNSTMNNSRNGSPTMTSSCSIKRALPFQLKNWSCISDTHTHNKNIYIGKGDPFRIRMAILGIYRKFRAVVSTCRFEMTPNKMRTAKTHSNLSSLSVAQHCILVPTPTVLLLLQVYLHTWVQTNDMNQLVHWCGSRWFAIRIRVALSNNFSHKDPRNPNYQVTGWNTDKIGAPRDPPGRIACSKMVFCSCETMDSHNQSEAFMTKIHITSSTVSKIQVMLSGFTPWFNDWAIYLLQILGCFPICYEGSILSDNKKPTKET